MKGPHRAETSHESGIFLSNQKYAGFSSNVYIRRKEEISESGI